MLLGDCLVNQPARTPPLLDPTDTSRISFHPNRGAGSRVYTCWRLCAPRNYNMVPYCVSWVVRWKKKGEKCQVWLWEPLDFSRRYHIVVSRFHYSGTRVYARISCSNHVLVRRINHSDRWGDQNPTFFSEIFPSLLPRTNRDSIIWQKDKGRVLKSPWTHHWYRRLGAV